MTHALRYSGWAALILGVSFTVGAAILIGVEPQMGFSSVADYWNPSLVVPALDSAAWLAADLCHLSNGVMVIILASTLPTNDAVMARLLLAFGLVSGTLFLLVAMLDRVGAGMPEFVQDPERLSVLAIAYVSARTGALLAAVFALGALILLISAANLRERWAAKWFSYVGFVVGAAAVLFFVVPVPIPVLLAIWALGLGVFLVRRPAEPASKP